MRIIVGKRAACTITGWGSVASDWRWEVFLEFGSYPDRSGGQAFAFASAYAMRSGKAKINVRRASLYYALRRLGLDTDPSAWRPQDQQIVLLNAAEIAHSPGGASP